MDIRVDMDLGEALLLQPLEDVRSCDARSTLEVVPHVACTDADLTDADVAILSTRRLERDDHDMRPTYTEATA